MVSSVESVDEHTQVTILFADVVGSTQLYELMGDDLARETIQSCVETMKMATDEYGGSVIKTMGDEVMSTFLSANDAIGAASQMQQQITKPMAAAKRIVISDLRLSVIPLFRFGFPGHFFQDITVQVN